MSAIFLLPLRFRDFLSFETEKKEEKNTKERENLIVFRPLFPTDVSKSNVVLPTSEQKKLFYFGCSQGMSII